METLSNFASIYCFITFIMGAVFMFIAVCTVAMNKLREPKNRVRFFVKKETSENYLLYIKGKDKLYYIVQSSFLKKFGLNPEDFADMKEDQIREVYINLED